MKGRKLRSFGVPRGRAGATWPVRMFFVSFWLGCISAASAAGTNTESADVSEFRPMLSQARIEQLLGQARAIKSDAEALAAYAWLRHELPENIAPNLNLRALQELSSRARSPLLRARARFDLARLYVQRGDMQKAAQAERELGLVQDAQLMGPFENNGAMAIFDAVPSESGPHRQDDEVSGLGRMVSWQALERNQRSGVWKLGHQLEPAYGVKALLRFAVYSPRSRDVVLRLGTSGSWAVSANGIELGGEFVQRDLHFDQSALPLRLPRGWTRIDLRIANESGPLDAVVRITDPSGRALPQLRFSATENDLQKASMVHSKAGLPKSPLNPLFRGCPTDTKEPKEVVSREHLWTCIGLEFALGTHDQSIRPTQLEKWVQAWDRQVGAGTGKSSEDFSRVHIRVADSLFDNDPTAARVHLERAVKATPGDVRALVALANLRASQGYSGEARGLFRRAAQFADKDVWFSLERMHFEREHNVGSIRQRSRVYSFAEANPVPAAFVAAAREALSFDDVKEALRWLQKLETWHSLHPLFLHTKIHLLAHDAEDARVHSREYVSLLERALARYPERHQFADRLARYWYARGEVDKARHLVQERKRLYPQIVEPLLLQTDLALLAGDRELAGKTLRSALQISPQSARISQLNRLLQSGQEDFSQPNRLEPRDMMGRPPAPDALEAGAEILGMHISIRYFENGLGKLVRDQVYRIHDPEKAKGLQQVPIRYSDGRENVEILVAERISKNGRSERARRIDDRGQSGKQGGMYTDARMKVVHFGELRSGDLIHIRSRTEWVGRQNLFGDFFGILEPMQSVVPVSDWRLVIEGPSAKPLFWGGAGVPEPVVSEANDRRKYEFQKDLIPRMETEVGMPPWLEKGQYISVSTYENWAEMGRWYAELIAEQLRLNDELKKIAAELVRGVTSDAEKVRRIYEFVVESTRYVGIELGIHGWKPYPVTEVYRRKYGDCKDKASMLVALLRESGIDAQIALVRTANLGVLPDTPATMWAFNHAIAYVPSLDLYLDGTAERSGYRELPHLDQGAMALLIASSKRDAESELRVIPVDDADMNLNQSSYELVLNESGSLRFEGNEKFRGTHNADQRAELQDEAHRREIVERSLASILPGASVDGVDVLSSALGDTWVEYNFRGTIPDRAVKTQRGDWLMPISLYPHGLTNSFARNSRRQHDVWLTYPWRTRNVMRYRLPDGYVVSDLPKSRSVESKHMNFSQRIREMPDGFVVEEDTQIKSRTIPLDEYQAFRKATLQADAIMKRKVRISAAGKTK